MQSDTGGIGKEFPSEEREWTEPNGTRFNLFEIARADDAI